MTAILLAPALVKTTVWLAAPPPAVPSAGASPAADAAAGAAAGAIPVPGIVAEIGSSIRRGHHAGRAGLFDAAA